MEFKQLMWEHMKELADEQCQVTARRRTSDESLEESPNIPVSNNNTPKESINIANRLVIIGFLIALISYTKIK